MSLGHRFWTGISAALIVTVLVAGPAFASEEDTKKADKTSTEKAAPAKADDAAECKPTAKFNTFEDLYGARNWLLRASATPAPAETTIVWREPVTAKPAANSTSKKN